VVFKKVVVRGESSEDPLPKILEGQLKEWREKMAQISKKNKPRSEITQTTKTKAPAQVRRDTIKHSADNVKNTPAADIKRQTVQRVGKPLKKDKPATKSLPMH